MEREPPSGAFPSRHNAVAIVLNGSPHRHGNGMTLAAAIVRAVGGGMNVLHLYEKNIAPCRACLSCLEDGRCPIMDDMPAVLTAISDADYVILASPLHFTSLSAPLIACISRLQPLWRSPQHVLSPAKRRIGALVVTGGGTYPDMFRPARSVALAAFNTLRAEYAGMLGVAETDTLSAADNPAALAEAEALAMKMLHKAYGAIPGAGS